MNPLAIAYVAARHIAASDPDFDDLAQEAALAVSAVWDSRPDASAAYLVGVAKMRIRNVLTNRRRWTGSSQRTAQALDPLRRSETASLDALIFDPPAPDPFEEAEWRILGGEIRDAVDELTAPQRAAAVGVAHGMSWAEIGRNRGVAPQSARESWVGARAHLRSSLAHLAPVVAEQ